MPMPMPMQNEEEIDDRHYYRDAAPPPIRSEGVLDGISKTVLILIFVAFIFGLMLGKSLTPIVLKG